MIASDIIFLDIFMPELDGIDVAHWLIEKRFNGKLVFMTGHDPTYLAAARAAARRGEAHVATLESDVTERRVFGLG
jgi:CheY-like chemotaxis protein